MTLTCPCCRVSNATDTCRRCKADLSVLAAVETAREYHLTLARRFAAELRAGEALSHLHHAAALRPGDDIHPLRAAVLLVSGRFADALAAYHATV
jgi:Flp pilus assembly protein TadD